MDPNLISQMMQNPEMMKMAEEMMKNNPNILSDMMNNMGGNNDAPNPEEVLKDKKFQFNDEVKTVNLSNENYNNKDGLVKNYNSETNRYEILVLELEKSISVKEENLILN